MKTGRIKVARPTRWALNDMVGAAEIAEITGGQRSQATAWLARTAHHKDPFPQPLLKLRHGMVWSKREVIDWLVRTERVT